MMKLNRPVFYPGDELHFAKLEKARAAMSKRTLDGALFLLPEAVRYFTDLYTLGPRVFWEYQYFALLTKKEVVLCYTSGMDDFRASKIKDLVTEARRVPKFEKWPVAIEKLLIDYGIQKGRICVDLLPFELFVALSKTMPGIRFESASDMWSELTSIKHPLEIEIIRRAIKIAEIGMRSAIDSLRENKTEMEIAAEAEYAMKREPDGSEISPFVPVIQGSGIYLERASTSAKLKAEIPVYIDLGAVYRGYTGEFGRTSMIGTPTKRQKEAVQALLKSLESSINIVKPGIKCSEIDKKAREVLRDAGFGEYTHRRATGHQLGYGLHSEPLIGPGVDEEIKENMIINLEPALIFPDDPEPWRVALEDTVLVTKDGYKYVTNFEYDSRFLS
jgi:Xaa-Pro aminopeptidase